MGPGCYVLSLDLARALLPAPQEPTADAASSTSTTATGEQPTIMVLATDEDGAVQTYRINADLDAAQLFRILPALQNLADNSLSVHIHLTVEAEAKGRFERIWLRNAVEEHLDEAGIDISGA